MVFMQLTSIVALLATLALASPVPAPATENFSLSARDTQFRLPPTVTLIAQLNGEHIGCLNGYGNLTRNLVWCFPFRVFYTDGNNGNDGNLRGYDYCRIGYGMLDGAQLDCSEGDSTPIGQFWNRDGFVSIDGPTGTYFSINSLPNLNDTVGVPLIIGGSGSYQQFQLWAKGVSG